MSRILIVEDEARIAAFLEKGLRKQGFSTQVAQDGEQAVLLAQNNEFDLLLLDLGLPIKDGWTVLKELRSQGNTIPTIILTARDDADDKGRGKQNGVHDYITKPFSFKDLIERIRRHLGV
jgi:two-component system, OmpR family, copper resistance phosphate regulon response regulator CusR